MKILENIFLDYIFFQKEYYSYSSKVYHQKENIWSYNSITQQFQRMLKKKFQLIIYSLPLYSHLTTINICLTN